MLPGETPLERGGMPLHDAVGINCKKAQLLEIKAQMSSILLLLFIIIIKKDWQCKAGRQRLTPYQSEDPNPTTPTHRMKEEKGKTA